MNFTENCTPLYDLSTLYPGAKVLNAETSVKPVWDNDNPEGKIRTRTTSTLDNGIVVVEDVYDDKIKYSDIKGEYKELPLKNITFPKIPDELKRQVKRDTKKAQKMWEKQKEERERMFDEEELLEMARHREEAAAEEAAFALSAC